MMAPEYPTPTMLALDAVEERMAELLVSRDDKRDVAEVFKREGRAYLALAEGKNLEADAVNRRLDRMPLVRSRILRSAS